MAVGMKTQAYASLQRSDDTLATKIVGANYDPRANNRRMFTEFINFPK